MLAQRNAIIERCNKNNKIFVNYQVEAVEPHSTHSLSHVKSDVAAIIRNARPQNPVEKPQIIEEIKQEDLHNVDQLSDCSAEVPSEQDLGPDSSSTVNNVAAY